MRAFVVALCCSLLAPAIAFAVVSQTDGAETALVASTPTTPVFSDVVEIEARDEIEATALIDWKAERVAYSPRSSGLATSVPAAPGAVLTTGSTVATIGGVTLLAYQAAAPFYRSLTDGDVGSDVVAAEELLLVLGYLDESDRGDGSYRWRMRQAARALNDDIGLASRDFDPSGLIWLGPLPLEVASVELQVGVQSPDVGAPLLIGPALPYVTAFRDAEGEPLAPSSLEDVVVQVDSETYSFEDGDIVEDQRSLLALQFPSAPKEIDVVIQRGSVQRFQSVAASAVVLSPDGGACVFDSELRPVEVLIVDSEPGRTFVRADSSEAFPTEVLVNPHQALASTTCA